MMMEISSAAWDLKRNFVRSLGPRNSGKFRAPKERTKNKNLGQHDPPFWLHIGIYGGGALITLPRKSWAEVHPSSARLSLCLSWLVWAWLVWAWLVCAWPGSAPLGTPSSSAIEPPSNLMGLRPLAAPLPDLPQLYV
jgi:hypothetical protein